MRVAEAEADATRRFRARGRAFAVGVGDRLLREQASPDSRGLDGPAGLAILYCALSELTGLERFTSAMHASLRQAAITDDFPPIGLFGGISGLRAAAALASRVDSRYAKLVAQADAYVDAHLPQHPRKPETFDAYDLIAGWSGARLARGVGGPLGPDRLVESILWTLEDPERWCCPHPLRPGQLAVNDLGLAHGVAGMLAALSLTLDPLDDPRAAVAMRDLCDARLSFGSHAVWPAHARVHDVEVYRSAWCYGATGVIAAIYATASALRDRATTTFALEAMRGLATQSIESWSLDNEAVCHGLIGNALCFASVGSASGSADLWNAALRIAEIALERLEANQGKCWARDFPAGRYDASGLLDGVAGIALSVLTLSGDADASWMRLFGLRPIS